MAEPGPRPRGAAGGAPDARRALDEIAEIVDELYALEDALAARVAPRLHAIRDELAGVLEDAVAGAAPPSGERTASELSYLDDPAQGPERAASAEPAVDGERRARADAARAPAAAARGVLEELHALRMETWRGAIDFVAECRQAQQQQFAELVRAIVQARRGRRRRFV